jgi:CRP-like cAMP-binding protein
MSDELAGLVEDLLISKEDALKCLARLAKAFISIERETGRPVYKIDASRLTQKDRLVMELVTDCLYGMAGLSNGKSDRVVLAERTGIKRAIINARFKELKDEGWIKPTRDGDELTTKGLVKATELMQRLQRELAGVNQPASHNNREARPRASHRSGN